MKNMLNTEPKKKAETNVLVLIKANEDGDYVVFVKIGHSQLNMVTRDIDDVKASLEYAIRMFRVF